MSFVPTLKKYCTYALVLFFQGHIMRRTCSAKSESRRMTDSFSTTKASIISTPSSSTSFLALSIPTLEMMMKIRLVRLPTSMSSLSASLCLSSLSPSS